MTIWEILAVAGAVAGAAVGLHYLVAALRPKPGEAPQREVSVTTAEEGASLARVYGSNGEKGRWVWGRTALREVQSRGVW